MNKDKQVYFKPCNPNQPFESATAGTTWTRYSDVYVAGINNAGVAVGTCFDTDVATDKTGKQSKVVERGYGFIATPQ